MGPESIEGTRLAPAARRGAWSGPGAPGTIASVARDPELAAWLLARRRPIEAAVRSRRPECLAGPGTPEAEALRRFRSFAAHSLRRGRTPPPSLDGVRVDPARAEAVIEAWCEAAVDCAGAAGPRVEISLTPLRRAFVADLRRTAPVRRRAGSPRSGRRAVRAAIDRVADAFLAVDTDTASIEDANPAAGALLGRDRDALLGLDLLSFVPPEEREAWWTQLSAAAEGAEAQRFCGTLCPGAGGGAGVEATVTRYSTRGRTLALILARPAVPEARSALQSRQVR